MKQSKFIIQKNSSISDALKKIDSNSSGFVLVESKEKIIGVLTDGDVRRRLLDGLTLQDKIDQCINTRFSYAIEGDSRESIIKQLDGEVHFIPLLDKKFKLIKIFTIKMLLSL